MPIPTDIGPYRIERELGRGGMGIVWLALDMRLDRQVAIKALPAAVATDETRLQRFEREAKLLASMHHTNIGAVYDIEEVEGSRYLVLEYVRGETLAARLERGALPVDLALTVAREIAEGLEYAHAQNIIHRDLKPANIIVTPEGSAKVLDFGIAKALDTPTPDSNSLADSPTVVPGATTTPDIPGTPTSSGSLLGTAGYMSPEQARGREVDRQTDIWALGCVLYEMLTGREAFGGDTVSDILASVLRSEPDFNRLPRDTPPAILVLVRRCLRKDRRRRLQDIGDARMAIEEAINDPSGASLGLDLFRATADIGAHTRDGTSWWILLAVIGPLLAALLTWAGLRGGAATAGNNGRFSIVLPPADSLWLGDKPSVAISPDGDRLALIGSVDGEPRLYVREIDDFSVREITSARGAVGPVFSPDGRWIAYVNRSTGTIQKVPVAGGSPIDLAESQAAGKGIAWGDDGFIYFTPSFNEGLRRVAAGGGQVETITTPDREALEKTHRFPDVLPAARGVLFMVGDARMDSYDDARIEVLDLATGARRRLIEGGMTPRYLASGHILYGRAGRLMAVPFDLPSLRVTGSALVVREDLVTSDQYGSAHFAIAPDGTLAYIEGGAETYARELIEVDLNGIETPLPTPVRLYRSARYAPDGKSIAVQLAGANDDIWTVDLRRSTLSRLTSGWDNQTPCFDADGGSVIFTSNRGGTFGLYELAADGSGEEPLPLLSTGLPVLALDTSRDGRWLLIGRFSTETNSDILVLDRTASDPEPVPVLTTTFDEHSAVFSPDGKWIAYVTDENGRDEVYMRRFPGPGGKWQISTNGGDQPAFMPGGDAILYRHGTWIDRVPVDLRDDPEIGASEPLLRSDILNQLDNTRRYDVAPDGTRLVLIRKQHETPDYVNVIPQSSITAP